MLISQELAKNLDLFSSLSFVNIGNNGMYVKIFDDSNEIISCLIEGCYPDFDGIIPDINKEHIEYTINKSETIEALKFLRESSKNHVARFSSGILSSSNEEGDVSCVDLGIGKENSFDFSFNTDFMLGILGQLENKTVSVFVYSKDRPFLIKEDVNSEELCVLMPVFIRD